MVEHRLFEWLREGRFILGDGAMGTMLQESGLTDGGAPELWNVIEPEKIAAIHQAYIEAGAVLIETNTFGGNLARLKFHDIGERVYELNRAGAMIAREAADTADHEVLVVGSIGPSGELIEPVGPLSMAEATELFAEQAKGLVAGGVDLFQIETMSHMNEVEAAIQGVRQVSDLPLVVTMSFDTNYHTMMGVSPTDAACILAGWGVNLIGANCGNGTDESEIIMGEMARNRPDGTYLIVYSNAGLPEYMDGEIHYNGTPERMAEYAVKMRNFGVNVIGGCCGSGPAHIARMREALEAIKDVPISGPPAADLNGLIESSGSRSARSAERRKARRQHMG